MTAFVRLHVLLGVGLVCAACPLGCSDAMGAGTSQPAMDAAAPSARTHCLAPPETRHAPRSIHDAVQMLNELPKPVSLACYLEQLERPLELYATRSMFSQQPAGGDRSPRIFVFSDALVMSIVPDGVGSHLLEFGERRSEMTSLKGEVAFPVTDELRHESAFEQTMFDDKRTRCSFCHRDEQPDELTADVRGFVSQALRPLPRDHVDLADLAAEHGECDPSSEPERCAMLDALFETGAFVEHEFPTSLNTFL